MHALRRLRLTQVAAQFVQQRWEILTRTGCGTAKSPRRIPITSGGAAEAQVDPAGKERFERAELLRNGQRRMIRQHDATGTYANCRGCIRNVTDQNRRR